MAMHPQNPEFLGEAGTQIAFLSAFLGGFAATFLGVLLNRQTRADMWAGPPVQLLSLPRHSLLRSCPGRSSVLSCTLERRPPLRSPPCYLRSASSWSLLLLSVFTRVCLAWD